MIKLLIGGSPCTFWSIAQKNNRETEAEGLGWELFKNYLIAKEKFKPDFFLYENNKSAAQAIKDQISRELGVELMYINSALVSAQNRQRFYAFNWEVEQPSDRGILLRDVLESGENLSSKEKSYALTTRCVGATPEDTLKRCRHTMIAEPVTPRGLQVLNINPSGKGINGAVIHTNGKARTLTTNKGEGQKIIVPINEAVQTDSMVAEPVRVGDIGSTSQAHRVYSCDGKSVTINAGGGGQGGKTGLYMCPATGKELNIYEVKNGLITIKGKEYPIKLSDGFYIIRKLTPVECERLQTLPDGYTKAVSNAQRYKGLGNGWTAEVIIHILYGALKDVPRDEEIVVLSMYDGIGTGRYCLEKMGFTNVKYYAYEIDKYAKQVSMSNYPDIIQMGDAFDVRHPDWTIGY